MDDVTKDHIVTQWVLARHQLEDLNHCQCGVIIYDGKPLGEHQADALEAVGYAIGEGWLNVYPGRIAVTLKAERDHWSLNVIINQLRRDGWYFGQDIPPREPDPLPG